MHFMIVLIPTGEGIVVHLVFGAKEPPNNVVCSHSFFVVYFDRMVFGGIVKRRHLWDDVNSEGKMGNNENETKENKTKENKSLYSFDNIVYIVFTAIVGLAIILSCALLECFNAPKVLSSIIYGLLSGLLASVIAAWILDYESCKRENTILNNAVANDLKYLEMWINDLFQTMRDSLLTTVPDEKMKRKDIYDAYVKQHKSKKVQDPLAEESLEIYVTINLIISTLDKLTTGKEKECLSLSYDMSSFLTLSKSVSDLRDNLFNNGNFNYDFIYSGFQDFLSTILMFGNLLKKDYSKTATPKHNNS